MRTVILFILVYACVGLSSKADGADLLQNGVDDNLYLQWIEIVKNTHSQHVDGDVRIYNILSENFYRKYRETSDPVFLNFALHEAGRILRNEIVDGLTEYELASVYDVVQKMHHQTIPSGYYRIREFSPSDIYTFIGYDIPEEMTDEALALLDYWYDSLDQTYSEDPIIASFKAQSLSAGYAKLSEFEKIADLTPNLLKYSPFPSSLFSLNLFEDLIYPLYMRGQYSLALQVFEQALLPIVKDLGNVNDIIYARMNYASTLFLIGKVDVALNVYDELYNDGIIDANSSLYLNLLRFLSISHLMIGNFDQYSKFQHELFEIGIRDNLHEIQLRTLLGLFRHHELQNDFSIAYDYLNQALKFALENDIKSELSGVLLSKGYFYRDHLNDNITALDYFYDALIIANETDYYRDKRIILSNIANTYALLRDHHAAEKYYEQAVELTSSGNDPVGYLSTSMSYAQWLIQVGRITEAQDLMENFNRDEVRTFPFYNRVHYHNVEISLLIKNGSYQEALSISNEVVLDVIDWILQSSDHQTGHMQIRTQFSEAFRLNNLLYEASGDAISALINNGRLRGISRTGFYNNPALKSNMLSEEDLELDYNLGVRIQSLRDRYAVGDEQQRNLIRTDLTNAVTERNRLVNQAFPRYLDSQYEELLRSRRTLLNRGEMVIYFSKFENQLFQFFITRSSVTMKSYPHDSGFYETINEAIASFGYRSTDLKKLHELHQTYFDGNIPSGINHIYIVPDDEFYRIPIEILPIQPVETSQSFGSARYMVEKYSISYLNTLADLQKKQSDNPADFDYDIAGFGISNFRKAGHQQLADLPFSPIEVVNSVKNLPPHMRASMFIEEESSESNFRMIAGNSRIIHMATHSRVMDNNPLFSSLYLYNDPNIQQNSDGRVNDGLIRAYEIFDLNLNADLVFLSSCESGSGGYIQGSGILGFSRAFSFAGAKSLILNLWPVRDQASAELTPQFYDYLNRGYDKAEAIREAKIIYINQRDSDPYLWGSFVLYGNIKPLIKQEPNYLFRGIVTVLSILGLLLLLNYFRRLF